MRMALTTGGVPADDVDYINAHGTSTQLNDATETAAIKQVFGDHATELKVSSTKSQVGHLLGAAGAVEAVATVLAIRDQYFPPTINHEQPDPACDLDYVPNEGRPGAIEAALSKLVRIRRPQCRAGIPPLPGGVKASRQQPVVGPAVAPRAASRDGSPLECSRRFATGCYNQVTGSGRRYARRTRRRARTR